MVDRYPERGREGEEEEGEGKEEREWEGDQLHRPRERGDRLDTANAMMESRAQRDGDDGWSAGAVIIYYRIERWTTKKIMPQRASDGKHYN